MMRPIRRCLPGGITWERLTAMSPDEIREQNLYPKRFLPPPHANHPEGGFVFPHLVIEKQDLVALLRAL